VRHWDLGRPLIVDRGRGVGCLRLRLT
jgi:hypothetical protein